MRSSEKAAAAAAAVGIALVVAAASVLQRPARQASVLDATRVVRIVWHDPLGLVAKQRVVRAPERVRALVSALGIDGHPSVACPADYSDAEISIVLAGDEVYARRSVHIWSFERDAGDAAPTVLSVYSAGCRRGPAADPAALRRELAEAASRDE